MLGPVITIVCNPQPCQEKKIVLLPLQLLILYINYYYYYGGCHHHVVTDGEGEGN